LTLLRSDTKDLPAKLYYIALQIKWSAGKVYEVDLNVDGQVTDRFKLEQDVVN
jgi:hypothetical protein